MHIFAKSGHFWLVVCLHTRITNLHQCTTKEQDRRSIATKSLYPMEFTAETTEKSSQNCEITEKSTQNCEKSTWKKKRPKFIRKVECQICGDIGKDHL